MKKQFTKLALSVAFGLALTLTLQSCATPLEKAVNARSKYLIENNSPVTQPPAEGETVLATYDASYSYSKNVKGELSFMDNTALLVGSIARGTTSDNIPTMYHITSPFSTSSATSELLHRYIRAFPNTSIEEVEYLDVRSVEKTGDTKYRIQTHDNSYTDKKGKRHIEKNFDAITTYYFKGVVVKLPPAAQPPQEQYQYPPPQEQYQYPPPQEQYYYPPPQEQYQYPPSQQQYQYPPPQEQYQYPPPQQQYYYPPPQGTMQ